MSKFAPANAEGQKPYVVTVWSWGVEHRRLGWGMDPQDAKWSIGGLSYTERITSVRRATPEDVEKLTGV